MKTLPVYILAGLLGLVPLYAGFSGKRILFIHDVRTAVITLAAAGFIMCSTGALAPFINKAPAHPLTISGYILGALALFTALVQLFNWNIPVLSDPKNGLIVITVIIFVKIIIARFNFIFI